MVKLTENSSDLELVEKLNIIREKDSRHFEFIIACVYNEPFCLMAVKLHQERCKDALIEFINSDRWQPVYHIE